MNTETYTAWDVGGAHLKVATVAADGAVTGVAQQVCQLWKGLDRLCEAVQQLTDRLGLQSATHAITMTGELADIFPNRVEGVQAIMNTMDRQLAVPQLRVFAGHHGLLSLQQAASRSTDVASANWLATARYVAGCVPDCLLVDMGSTTTDILPVQGGTPVVTASDDAGRMRTEELLYAGVIRTPVMAICRRVVFDAEWHTLAAEHFATAGDVYRLTGELSPDEDMEDTADGQGKSAQDSARRLARMLGMDYEYAQPHQWQGLARSIARQQQFTISQSIEKALSQRDFTASTPLVGAGAGRFLVKRIADDLQRPYIDIAELFDVGEQYAAMAAVCAPAVSLACLLRSSLQ
jgi:probable H4MPT-linked C1 transfer pathway protein